LSAHDWAITRLAPTLGARVEGLDLETATATELDVLAELLYEHLVLALPDQHLTVDRHVELGERFGEPLIHPFLDAVPEHPAILQVLKEPQDRETFGGEFWHADITFIDPPSSVSILHGIEIPVLGGDTLFASQFAAYDALSPRMKLMLDGLTATHSYPDMPESPYTTAIHPVIRAHPVSGRKAIFVNQAFTARIEELSAGEGRAMLDFLFAHSCRPEFQVRVGWSPGHVLLWDNRAVQHYALNDYQGVRRRLRRVTTMERSGRG
jgi:taurine dioxygenase